ncbi:RluA family pseudouridine synthase [Allofustis seminis]|uniref:RluA family pseudouridine synthase n=1 Tax=Allofustis seminis TaxID=166939 RepID=UPI0003652DD6|nr:RluA family pseudouridine synthase [Allofustis seminis]
MVNIIYEDNHLLIVEKPVNIPVQEDASQDIDLLRLLKNYLIKKYNKPGEAYLGLIHRLDRPVGGVMVFAKTSKAASRLSNQLRLQEIKRTYLTVVDHNFAESSGKLTDYLFKDRQNNISYVVSPSKKGAKKAILNYNEISKKNGRSLLKVQLQTGRSHQIRVQLSAAGHPIIGDQKYGQAVSEFDQQIALWSYALEFTHPTKKEKMCFKSLPAPQSVWKDFAVILSQLK